MLNVVSVFILYIDIKTSAKHTLYVFLFISNLGHAPTVKVPIFSRKVASSCVLV